MIRQLLRATSVFAALFLSTPQVVAEGEGTREGGLTGTGIIGEVMALGSIIVNGQRITFAHDLTVDSVLGTTLARDLVPGDIVAVAVAPQDQHWTAEAITQMFPLVGPVDAVNDATFTILGVEIAWPNAAALLSTGNWVAVSGFWARDTLQPTRLQIIEPQDHVSVQGSYRLLPEGETATIGPFDLNIERLQHARDGDVIRVDGQWRNNALVAQGVHLGLFDRPVGLVLAQGYLSDVAASGHYTVSGTGLSAYTDNLQADMKEERVTVCGINGALVPTSDLPQRALAAMLGCPDNPY
jgi:hypothetical protein